VKAFNKQVSKISLVRYFVEVYYQMQRQSLLNLRCIIHHMTQQWVS